MRTKAFLYLSLWRCALSPAGPFWRDCSFSPPPSGAPFTPGAPCGGPPLHHDALPPAPGAVQPARAAHLPIPAALDPRPRPDPPAHLLLSLLPRGQLRQRASPHRPLRGSQHVGVHPPTPPPPLHVWLLKGSCSEFARLVHVWINKEFCFSQMRGAPPRH